MSFGLAKALLENKAFADALGQPGLELEARLGALVTRGKQTLVAVGGAQQMKVHVENAGELVRLLKEAGTLERILRLDLGRFSAPGEGKGLGFQPNLSRAQFQHVYSVLLALHKESPDAVTYAEERFEQHSLQKECLVFRERRYQNEVKRDVKIRMCDVDCSQGALGCDFRVSQALELPNIRFEATAAFQIAQKERFQFTVPRPAGYVLWIDMTETRRIEKTVVDTEVEELQVEMELHAPRVTQEILADFVAHATALAQVSVDVLATPASWKPIQLFQEDHARFEE